MNTHGAQFRMLRAAPGKRIRKRRIGLRAAFFVLALLLVGGGMCLLFWPREERAVMAPQPKKVDDIASLAEDGSIMQLDLGAVVDVTQILWCDESRFAVFSAGSGKDAGYLWIFDCSVSSGMVKECGGVALQEDERFLDAVWREDGVVIASSRRLIFLDDNLHEKRSVIVDLDQAAQGAFNPIGTQLAFTGQEGVFLYSLEDGETKQLISMQSLGISSPPFSVCWSGDHSVGYRFATEDWRRFCGVVDAEGSKNHVYEGVGMYAAFCGDYLAMENEENPSEMAVVNLQSGKKKVIEVPKNLFCALEANGDHFFAVTLGAEDGVTYFNYLEPKEGKYRTALALGAGVNVGREVSLSQGGQAALQLYNEQPGNTRLIVIRF